MLKTVSANVTIQQSKHLLCSYWSVHRLKWFEKLGFEPQRHIILPSTL